MALYKYIELARDIDRLCNKRHLTTFTSSEVYRHINTRNGFYTYSHSTLIRAIDHLIHTNKVIARQSHRRYPYVFVYIPLIVSIHCTKEISDERRF